MTAAPDLERQRVTLFVRDMALEALRDGTARLLSAEPDGAVSWRRLGGDRGWRLEQSRRRRELAARLRNMDQALFLEHVAREIAWLTQRGAAELEAEPEEGPRRWIVEDRYSHALLLKELDEATRTRLLQGEPINMTVGKMPGAASDLFRKALMIRTPPVGQVPRERLDSYWYVFLRERHPVNPAGGGLTYALVSPEGFQRERGPMHRPYNGLGTYPPDVRNFDFAGAARAGEERRVTLWLTREPQAEPGAAVTRNLDQLLEAVSTQAGVNVIADGYLRSVVRLPANFEVKDCPLDSLLTTLTRPWGCEWRFLDEKKTTVLVRARYWWLEDMADVPDDRVEAFRESLGPGRTARLEDLAALAELSDAQIGKLVETGACPAAAGLVDRYFPDGAGVKPCLRFYSKLPTPLKEKAASEAGLPLRETNLLLHQSLLYPTLVCRVGAVTDELRSDLIFRIQSSKPPRAPGFPTPGWVITIWNPKRLNCRWSQFVGAAPALTDRSGG